MSKHITLTCPICTIPDKAVGDPDSHRWHCFNCRADGTFSLAFAVRESSVAGPSEEDRAGSPISSFPESAPA